MNLAQNCQQKYLLELDSVQILLMFEEDNEPEIEKGIRKMLIRHAILEMFKYLEPDSNLTPSQIEITRLQNLIASSTLFFIP